MSANELEAALGDIRAGTHEAGLAIPRVGFETPRHQSRVLRFGSPEMFEALRDSRARVEDGGRDFRAGLVSRVGESLGEGQLILA